MTSVKNAKMSAANSSALGYIDGVNKSLELNAFEKGETKYALYTLADINTNNILSDNIKIQGNTPTDAIIYVSDNSVVNANICIDGYNVIYNGATSEVVGECNTLYKETTLNGSFPVYSSNLIPVTINNGDENPEDAGKVYKANVTDTWYNYNNKQWANAVILKSSAKDKYKDKPSGTEISLSDIESYFVWIPKYSYQLFSVTKYTSVISEKPTTSIADTIDIRFGTTNTSNDNTGECTTPMVSGETGECEKDDYMTHPAFISMNTNGFWAAKFETTGSTTNLSVLPGATSLRSQTVKSMFELAYNYSRNNDSHMMKNTEWGAVAYLSHSAYGIGTEVRINNNSDYKTGYASVTAPTCYGDSSCNDYGNTSSGKSAAYNTSTGYLASTTGNITGVYDMSGGAHEYMAAYRADTYKDSGFDVSTISKYNSKYFDVYASDSNTTTYNKMIIGDATGEMGPFYSYADADTVTRYHNNWYADNSIFAFLSYPWFGRGGDCYHGVLAGQFYFYRYTGGSAGDIGFRLVLNH